MIGCLSTFLGWNERNFIFSVHKFCTESLWNLYGTYIQQSNEDKQIFIEIGLELLSFLLYNKTPKILVLYSTLSL